MWEMPGVLRRAAEMASLWAFAESISLLPLGIISFGEGDAGRNLVPRSDVQIQCSDRTPEEGTRHHRKRAPKTQGYCSLLSL